MFIQMPFKMKTPRLKKRGVVCDNCNGLSDLDSTEHLYGKAFLSLIDVGTDIHFVVLDELFLLNFRT